MSHLLATEDGSHTLQSAQFGVTYHSIHGALQETQTVFIEAGLKHKALETKTIDILDIGFGTGLNAWMSFLEAERAGYTLRYTGVEAYPLPMNVVELLNYPEVLGVGDQRALFLQLHQSENQWISLSDRFHVYKKIAFFQDINDQEAFDVIYYDAFAPTAQPELWEEAQLARMYAALRPGGILTTYCAKGSFKRALRAVGFTLEGLPGPKGKREMTRAKK